MSDFTTLMKNIVRKIPAGQTMSYQAVAANAGNEKAARAVANIMASNYDPEIPCHRVVRSNGQIGGYNRGGEKVKKQLLLKEGVVL